MHAAFGVDPGRVFFGVGRTWQDYIRPLGPGIPVVALVDHKGVAQIAPINFVGPQQVDYFDVARCRGRLDPGHVAPTLAGQQTQIQTGHPRRCRVQNIEAVPIVGHPAPIFGDGAGRGQYRCAVAAGQSPLANDDHAFGGLGQFFGCLVIGHCRQGLWARAQIFCRECQI